MCLIGGSTYLLLDSTIKYKDILNLFYSHLSQNSHCPLEKIEEHNWMLAELVRDFFYRFLMIQQKNFVVYIIQHLVEL